MSSLMQFTGTIERTRGVGLEFYRVIPNERYNNADGTPSTIGGTDAEVIACPQCGRTHPQLYVAYRKPKGMFGCWVVFRYNGADHVPDLSVPIATLELPKDAKPLTVEQNAARWHSE